LTNKQGALGIAAEIEELEEALRADADQIPKLRAHGEILRRRKRAPVRAPCGFSIVVEIYR
jgi:hypothetical protein